MDMFNFQWRPKGEKDIFSFPYVSTGTTVNYTVASDVVSLCLWEESGILPNMFRGTFPPHLIFSYMIVMRTYSVN